MKRLAIDIGASFVDLCLYDTRSCRVRKMPVQRDLWSAVTDGVKALHTDIADLDEIRIASTAPLNELLTRTQAKTVLLTTRGFADTLVLGRQDRMALYEPVARSAAPVFLAEPGQVHEIGGRLDADGNEVVPLDMGDVERALIAISEAAPEAVAVCFLFAHVNPEHEARVAEAIAASMPGMPVSLSHAVDPAPREYERTVATLLDTWIRASGLAAMTALTNELRASGFGGRLLAGDGRGVILSDGAIAKEPAALVVAGPAAAARCAAQTVGGDGVAIDIGSQSSDFTLFRGSRPTLAERGALVGLPWRHDLIDTESLAIGGMRCARIEAAGIGFKGDDARLPTLDDALAHIGRLPGGDQKRATRVEALAARHESSASDLAHRIVEAAETELAEAAIRFATRRNLDPTRATLAIMGGTGGLIAAGIARAMGIDRVALPIAPAAAGAMGLALAPERYESTRRLDRRLPDLSEQDLVTLLAELDQAVTAQTGGEPATGHLVSIAARPQMHMMRLELSGRPIGPNGIAVAFREAYRERYGIDPPGPGYVGALTAFRETASAVPVFQRGSEAATGPALVATEAGSISVPDGWRLTASGAAYLLERTRP